MMNGMMMKEETNKDRIQSEDEGERGTEEGEGGCAEPVDAVGVRPVERDLVAAEHAAELCALAEEREQQRRAERPRVAPHKGHRRQEKARRKARADQEDAEQQHRHRGPKGDAVVQ